VATAIAALSEKFKSVVILRDVESMPYEEIADVLEIPVGTVDRGCIAPTGFSLPN
jgi:DNA-directed RNA polymerase specialized sigma24 family protein